MRTTLTLDDDVAAKLKAEQSRAGLPLKEIVNETLRRGLASRGVAARVKLSGSRPAISADLSPARRWTMSRN
jgi:hypothetical protein